MTTYGPEMTAAPIGLLECADTTLIEHDLGTFRTDERPSCVALQFRLQRKWKVRRCGNHSQTELIRSGIIVSTATCAHTERKCDQSLLAFVVQCNPIFVYSNCSKQIFTNQPCSISVY